MFVLVMFLCFVLFAPYLIAVLRGERIPPRAHIHGLIFGGYSLISLVGLIVALASLGSPSH